MPDYGSGGLLFPVKSDNEKAPVYEGHIEITKDDLRELVGLAQASEDIKMRLVTFKRQGKNGPFMSLALKSWAVHEEERADYLAKRQGNAPSDGDFNGGMDGSSDPWAL
tara:strand:+ start:171 stop:497 length:327 start_codon:yes stop_codon:yes gene_type:complete